MKDIERSIERSIFDIFGDYKLFAMLFCGFEKRVERVFEVMEGEVNHSTIQKNWKKTASYIIEEYNYLVYEIKVIF